MMPTGKNPKAQHVDAAGIRRVLADHRQVGKRLTPPLLAFGAFREVSWVKTGIPETIWLAICHASCTPKQAVGLGETVVEALRTVLPDNEQLTTFSVSNLGGIAEEYREPVRTKLAAEGALFVLQRVLQPLRYLYPDFPMKWLWATHDEGVSVSRDHLSELKAVLVTQFDKTTREAMFVQTPLVHLAFVSGRLHVREGLTLARYASVADYPLTQESKLVAASVRATVNSLFDLSSDSTLHLWPKYFWNRGLELEPCQTPDDFPFLDLYAQSTTADR